MKQSKKALTTIALVIVTAFAAACSSTRPVAEWRDQNYTGGSVNNILIVGVSERAAVRRSFEDAFVEKLGKIEIRAVSSAEVMPSDAEINEETVSSTADANQLDAVLITHLIGVSEKEVYNPPTYTPAPYYGGMYGYYGRVRGYVYEPGYYTRHELVKLETNLYEVESGNLIWSMQSETMDPSSEQKLINEKIDVVVKQLSAQGLL